MRSDHEANRGSWNHGRIIGRVISPPIGLNLFVISGISRVPVVDVFRGTLPFACVLLVMLVAMIFIPGFIFR